MPSEIWGEKAGKAHCFLQNDEVKKPQMLRIEDWLNLNEAIIKICKLVSFGLDFYSKSSKLTWLFSQE